MKIFYYFYYCTLVLQLRPAAHSTGFPQSLTKLATTTFFTTPRLIQTAAVFPTKAQMTPVSQPRHQMRPTCHLATCPTRNEILARLQWVPPSPRSCQKWWDLQPCSRSDTPSRGNVIRCRVVVLCIRFKPCRVNMFFPGLARSRLSAPSPTNPGFWAAAANRQKKNPNFLAAGLSSKDQSLAISYWRQRHLPTTASWPRSLTFRPPQPIQQ